MRYLRPTALLFLFTALIGPASGQAPAAKSEGERQLVIEVKELPALSLTPQELADGLGQSDLEARELYLDQLIAQLGSKDPASRSAQKWLEETSQGKGEAAWTARLVLRELRLSERLASEDLFMVGDPMAELMRPGSGGRRVIEVRARATDSPDDSEKIEGLEQWLGGVRGGMQRFPVADIGELAGCTFELRCGPDDVRLRIIELPEVVDGGLESEQRWETRVREYSGSSLAEILSEHPDLCELMPFQVPGVSVVREAVRTDVLGVYTQPVTEERRASLGLPPGVGLEVARIAPDTIAQALGIDRGAVIWKLCGHDVSGGDGISSLLNTARDAAAKDGAEFEVAVEWFDAWGQRQRRIWRGTVAAK